MRAATMFSGIDAPRVAMPHLDWRWCAEIDKHANQIRFGHWPDETNLGDVNGIDPGAIEPVECLVFGSPCQSFSVAGKRLGMDDPRGNMALVALALVRKLRPRWFVFENVRGLLSSRDDLGCADFGRFLESVRECGYTGAYRMLDAQYFGQPQRRRRLFFVGHLGTDWRPSGAVLFEPESLRRDSPPRDEPRQGSEQDAGTEGGLGGRGVPRIARTLEAFTHGYSPNDQTLIAADLAQITSAANRSRPRPGDPCHTLSASSRSAIAFNCQEDLSPGAASIPLATQPKAAVAVQYPPRSSNTLVAKIGCGDREPENFMPAQLHPQSVAPALWEKAGPAGWIVRRLTPLECERLQGFPDGFTEGVSDTQRYKVLGNSMNVSVMRWILSRLEAVDAAWPS